MKSWVISNTMNIAVHEHVFFFARNPRTSSQQGFKMWVIDMRHWLNEDYDAPAAPRLKLKVDQMKEIIMYAASQIHWFCPFCGNESVLRGWSGLMWDVSFSSHVKAH